MCYMKLIWKTGRTQNISSIGLFYKNVGNLLGGCLTVKNQWELLTGNEGNVISGSKEKECDAMDKHMDA